MTAALPLRARLALARLAEVELAQVVYEADIAVRGVVAVVAPYVPSQRRVGQ